MPKSSCPVIGCKTLGPRLPAPLEKKEIARMASALDLQLQVRCTETDPRYGRPLDVRTRACGGGRRALTLEIGLEPPDAPCGDDDDYPEGGWEAWLVVLGAWCAMVPSMGMINTFGVLQAWVAQHELAGYSEASVGWIFSIHAFVVYFAGAQAGTLFKSYATPNPIDQFGRIAVRCLRREAACHSGISRGHSGADVFQC